MNDKRPYGSPTAFRTALTDRLRELAKTSRWELPQLQRQVAYDRLLQRLYLVDDGWIVKGATALVARDLGVRASIDIDIYRAKAGQAAEAELREAAARDIDWFHFEIGATQPLADGSPGVRLPIAAYVGPAVWVEFHVDLVGADIVMTGTPDDVPPLAPITMPDFEQRGYRAYPLVDHIADKITATLQRYGAGGRPSTRYRDLVDLVAIVSATPIAAHAQTTALASEAKRRGIALPDRFDVPDRTLWEAGYAAEAGRSLLSHSKTLAEAMSVVSPFVDPLLNGTATGTWNPASGTWL